MSMARRLLPALVAIVVVVLLGAACASDSSTSGGDVGERPVRVTTTANFITDLAEVIGGERVEVTGLLGPGVDPHLYKASAGDVAALRDADVVFYGGLDLEGRMADVLDELSDDKPTIAVSEGIPDDRKRQPTEFEGKFDPHIWFSVPLWREAVDAVEQAYVELDPDNADGYRERADAYRAELEALDAEVREKLASIPDDKRVLVTSHDAFGYFGEEYDFEVVGIQGTSTATEATTADIDRVAGVIADRGLEAVFIESTVSPQTIRAVLAAAERRGQTARIGGELFADAAGERGTPEGTYIGMVRHNVGLIAEGLAPSGSR
jgi:manganese/zinc/iron transport system substrate-binding protein